MRVTSPSPNPKQARAEVAAGGGGGASLGQVPCSPPAALCRLCERLFPEAELAEHLVTCARRCVPWLPPLARNP